MKNLKIIMSVILGSVLVLSFAACSPKGGTITLVNETNYTLNNCYISLGKTEAAKLEPGEWMKAGHDKNVVGANVRFTCAQLGNDAPNKIVVPNYGTDWGLLKIQFYSSLISVQNGEDVIVAVREKQ